MAAPEGNPPPHSTPPAEPPTPQVPPAALPKAVTTAPRANPPSVFNPKGVPPTPPAAASPNELIAWLQSFAANQTAPPQQRTTLSKKEKKFHRYEPEAPKVGTDGSSVMEEGELGLKTPGRADLPPPPGETPVVRKRRLKPASVTEGRWGRWLWSQLIRAALVVGIFMAGRLTAPDRHPVAVSAVPRASVDRAEPNSRVPDLIDQAMTAESKMDFAKATGLLEEVQRQKSHVMGVDYHLALLAFESGDMERVLPLLNQSIEKGEEVAACYNLRGTLANRVGGLGHGMDDLQTATLVDPYNAKYFYFAGEALRRAGKPMAALQRLSQASDRVRDPGLQSLYDLKVRLAQIELGQEAEFAGQLAIEMRRAPPSIDWLFTAAAVAMRERRFGDASGYLDKVLTLTDQTTMNIRLSDYFFYGYANEKQLARFYAPMRPVSTPAPAPNPTTSPPPRP